MSRESFSRRERQIMDIVYRLGEATVADVLAGMDDPLHSQNPSTRNFPVPLAGAGAFAMGVVDPGHVRFKVPGEALRFATSSGFGAGGGSTEGHRPSSPGPLGY